MNRPYSPAWGTQRADQARSPGFARCYEPDREEEDPERWSHFWEQTNRQVPASSNPESNEREPAPCDDEGGLAPEGDTTIAS